MAYCSLFKLSRASPATIAALNRDFLLVPKFMQALDQVELLAECQRALRKASWCESHFDSVIKNYRETHVSRLTLFPRIAQLLKRCTLLLRSQLNLIEPHILELAPNGEILPHLDQVHLQVY